MAALNLMMALGWWLLAGSFAPFATALGLLCLIMSVMFLRTRIGAMRDYRADDQDDQPGPRAAELRSADAPA
jgi:multisubunit Na+/H+ antiporter MnhE subunit